MSVTSRNADGDVVMSLSVKRDAAVLVERELLRMKREECVDAARLVARVSSAAILGAR